MALGRAGVLPRRAGPDRMADRPPADADPDRRHRDLAGDHDARGSPWPPPDADRRRAADGGRGAGVRVGLEPVGAPGGRHHRRAEPERPRGRTVPVNRAGGALAGRDRGEPDACLCLVHADRLGGHGARGARRRRHHTPPAGRGADVVQQLPRGGHRLRRARRGAGRRVRAVVASDRGDPLEGRPAGAIGRERDGAAPVAARGAETLGPVCDGRLRRRLHRAGVHGLLVSSPVRRGARLAGGDLLLGQHPRGHFGPARGAAGRAHRPGEDHGLHPPAVERPADPRAADAVAAAGDRHAAAAIQHQPDGRAGEAGLRDGGGGSRRARRRRPASRESRAPSAPPSARCSSG